MAGLRGGTNRANVPTPAGPVADDPAGRRRPRVGPARYHRPMGTGRRRAVATCVMIAAAVVCAVLLGPASSGPVDALLSPVAGVTAPAPVTSSRAAAGSIDAAGAVRVVPVGVAVGAAIHGAVTDPVVVRGPVPFDLAVPVAGCGGAFLGAVGLSLRARGRVRPARPRGPVRRRGPPGPGFLTVPFAGP